MRRSADRLHAAAFLALAFVAGGCAGPSTSKGLLVPVASPAAAERTRTIVAVTTRGPAAEQTPGMLYSGERGDQVRFTSLTLSLPPGRVPGSVPTDAERPDLTRHIALVSARDLSAAQFAALSKSGGRSPAKRRALVFTHGFNTKFDQAVMRFAQIVDDTGFEGLPVLFSWPSRGGIANYGYDKDSANFSRDAMANLLAALARDPGISGIDIFAHSMGNWLTMETLRQLAIAKDKRTLDRLGTIILAAPDVDMDVFRTQIARLGPVTGRMVLYASKDDHALRLSRRLFGGKIRAGENTDLEQFRVLGVSAHDLSGVSGGVGRNHGKAFADGATIATIGHALSDAPPSSGESLSEGWQSLTRSVTTFGEAAIPADPQGSSP